MRRTRTIVFVVALAMSAATAAAASPGDPGEPIKLNRAMHKTGDVNGVLLAPDGSRVVYWADQNTDKTYHLYSAPVDGSGPRVRLATGQFRDVKISPDSTRVLYIRYSRRARIQELYSVPIVGGPATRLFTPSFDGQGSIDDEFEISPDSTVAVLAIRHGDSSTGTEHVDELYAVPVTGGAPVKLSRPPDPTKSYDLGYFHISADSTTVVYQGAHGSHGSWGGLNAVPITGGPVVELISPDPERAGFVRWHRISPDSARVVYVFREDDTPREWELYSIPIGGGTAVKLNGPLTDKGDVRQLFEFSPDSAMVVYRADQDTDGQLELFSVPIGGGTAVKLNGPLVEGGDILKYKYEISPDSKTVVYVADQDTDDKRELYSVPIRGGTPTKLNAPMSKNGDVFARSSRPFFISPNSKRVVYRADQDQAGVWELYSVRIGGGTPTHIKLNAALPPGGDVKIDPGVPAALGVVISPDSKTVVYVADQDTNNKRELYSVPIRGGTPTKLNASLPTSGDLLNKPLPYVAITADSTRAVYVADQNTNNKRELYAVELP